MYHRSVDASPASIPEMGNNWEHGSLQFLASARAATLPSWLSSSGPRTHAAERPLDQPRGQETPIPS
jgi:hypothetical protein